MYLKEAYAIFLESCKNEDEKCIFSTFCNLNPENVLLLGNSPKEQHKCQIHKNLFHKLEAMGYDYKNSWWGTVLCDTSPNSSCWSNTCHECSDRKEICTEKSIGCNHIIQAVEYH